MAKQIVTTTQYTDDLDGSTAVGTITFGFDGTNYEIDLSKSNAKTFERVLAPYVASARRVRNSRARSSSRLSAAKRDLGAVRTWAEQNGYKVSARGRVATEILDAYNAAH